jgi:glycosyltransferase involved in cell wall biosynthesis
MRRRTARVRGAYFGFIEVGRRFASAVRDELKRRDLPSKTIFYAYDTGALESLEYLKERGVVCIVNQMDPNRVERDVVCEEIRRSAGWERESINIPEAYFQRREKEWALADRIVVNSEFSRQALVRQGVPPEKLAVIPLCYEPGVLNGALDSVIRCASWFSPSKPLKVLFLGQVILRKGIRYLVESAELLKSEPVHFDVVGPIGISPEAVKSAPPNLRFHGRANRDEASRWYGNADIFVLPTLSDGFALTQLEAMAHGLPVITTSNCGAVVTHDVDGLVVAAGDASALAAAIQSYVADPARLQAHQAGAREKIGQFTLGHLARNLASLEAELVA